MKIRNWENEKLDVCMPVPSCGTKIFRSTHGRKGSAKVLTPLAFDFFKRQSNCILTIVLLQHALQALYGVAFLMTSMFWMWLALLHQIGLP